MTPGSSRPVAYFPQYLSPLASAGRGRAADLGEGPVPFTLTPAAAAAIEDMEMEAGS